jgi:hypothetical protein
VLLDLQNEEWYWKKTQEWYCNSCGVTHYPKKEEKSSELTNSVPLGPETNKYGGFIGDKMPIISIIDNTPNLRPKNLYFLVRLKC